MIIGIFVDDLLVTGNSVSEINKVREVMSKCYLLTDQGHLEYYLGVEVRCKYFNVASSWLYQQNTFNMSECSPVSTPLPHNLNLSLLDCPDEVTPNSKQNTELL